MVCISTSNAYELGAGPNSKEYKRDFFFGREKGEKQVDKQIQQAMPASSTHSLMVAGTI